MAEAVFRKMVSESGLTGQIEVDSAGISGWHAGERPHDGTLQVLGQHNIPHDWIRSRQIQATDLMDFDYIVAMDDRNLRDLSQLEGTRTAQVFKLLDLVPDTTDKDVPDPYYTGNFDAVFSLVNKGCEALLRKIAADHSLYLSE